MAYVFFVFITTVYRSIAGDGCIWLPGGTLHISIVLNILKFEDLLTFKYYLNVKVKW